MCSTNTDSQLSSSAHALNIDIVLERILSCLDQDKETPNDVIKYRLVNHRFNDTIVRIIKKSKQSFQIRLRYESDVPGRLVKSGAQSWAKETFGNILCTATPLPFDTVVVDRDFYLAGVMHEWSHFLKLYGDSIQHLKFHIRHSTDCEEIVSRQNVVAAFFATPNLESLDFSIRFSDNSSPICETLPKLQKLTCIKIQEPERAYYSIEFVREIFAMASNLTTVYIKPSRHFLTFADALKALEPRSLTSLSVDNAQFHNDNVIFENLVTMTFSYCTLTTLQLNEIHGEEKYLWIQLIIKAHHSSLEKLILGYADEDEDNVIFSFHPGRSESIFTSVMENLKVLEVNLCKFQLRYFDVSPSYGIRFPVLESIVFKGYGEHGIDGNDWTHEHLNDLLPGDSGKSQTVKEFILRGQINNDVDNRLLISRDVSSTFPCAVQHFDDYQEQANV